MNIISPNHKIIVLVHMARSVKRTNFAENATLQDTGLVPFEYTGASPEKSTVIRTKRTGDLA